MKCKHCGNEIEYQEYKNKGKIIRIYKWEDKKFKDFPMPKGFNWCEQQDFINLINDKKIELEKYPVYYYLKNPFKINIQKGYSLAGLYLGRDLGLSSDDYGSLDCSVEGGRVVIEQKVKERK